MNGKEKCKILKEIRAEIARANEIAWVTENCTHKGDCRGTCPKCEAEVRALERALERRRAMGKMVAVIGLSAGIIATSVSCEALSDIVDHPTGAMTTTAPTAYAPSDSVDSELDGKPLPPETGEEMPDTGDLFPDQTTAPDELEGEPADPVYFQKDFQIPTKGALIITAVDKWAYPLLSEDESVGDRVAILITAGQNYVYLGDFKDMGVQLIYFQQQYWAIPIATEKDDAEDLRPEDVLGDI